MLDLIMFFFGTASLETVLKRQKNCLFFAQSDLNNVPAASQQARAYAITGDEFKGDCNTPLPQLAKANS